MASKYAKPLQVPTEFPDVLRTFAREVLRLQGKVETKEQIYEFAVQYFQTLISKREGAGGGSSGAGTGRSTELPEYMKMAEDEMKSVLTNAVEHADAENNGAISCDALKEALSLVAKRLEFSPIEIKALLAEGDENEGGMISVGDFLPLAFQAIMHLRATRPQRVARFDSFQNHEGEVFLHGYTQDELESLVREILQRADTEDTGLLSRLQFMDALRDADLGFTRREVNILMAEAPLAESDPLSVSYTDFIAACFQTLRGVFVEGAVDIPSDQDALAQYLHEVFSGGEGESTGLLPVSELTKLFRAADIGLTRLQIITLMAEAQEDMSGFVNYEKFATHVAGMVLVLASFDSQQSFAKYLQKYRKSGEYYTILGMNQHSFEQTLSRALEALDETQRGLLPRQEVIEAIQNSFPEISQRQMRCLLALAEVDEMGDVEYSLITHSAFPALQKLQEYDMMIMES